MTTPALTEEELREFPSWFEPVFRRLQQARYVFILIWVFGLVAGGIYGSGYIKKAEDTPHAPGGSRAFNDLQVFIRTFPRQAQADTLIVFVQCKNPSSATCSVVCKASDCALHGGSCHGEHPAMSKAFEQMSRAFMAETQVIVGAFDYYNLSHTTLDAVKCSLASADGKATFATFFFAPEAGTDSRRKFINRVKDQILPSVNPNPDEYEFDVTGFEALSKDGSEQAMTQFFKADIVALPLAFGLLGYMVRSWRLWLLALMNTGVAVAVSFGFLALLSDLSGKKPLSTTSSLVEVLGLSMSIDYSLFLLRRFRDELANGRATGVAQRLMLLHAGHVVCLSSGTFAMVFVGLMFLDSEDLALMGQASTITVLLTVLVCVTNTVAMLTTLPAFFSKGISLKRVEVLDATTAEAHLANDSLTLGSPLLRLEYSPARTVTGRLRHKRGAPYKGRYFDFLVMATKWPFNFFFVASIYLLAVPLALQVARMKQNQDVVENITRSAPSARVFSRLVQAFPGGTLAPYYVVLAGPEGAVDVNSDRDGPVFFHIMGELSMEFSQESGWALEIFNSPASLRGKLVSYQRAKSLLDSHSLVCRMDNKACGLYQYEFAQATCKDAMLMTIILPESPYGFYGHRLIKAIEAVMDRAKLPEGYSVHLAGTEVSFYSDMRHALKDMPALFGVTLTILFALVGLGFKSALVPIRLSLTLIFPLLAVFGTAVLVYQDGVLNWLGVAALSSKYSTDGFFWYIPIIAILQCIGLCLDYDVFICARILEHRVDGYEIRAAIIKAVWEVNSQIVAAGAIMAFVFSGLLLGDSLSVNQFGYLLCASVVVDTFIVQTLLVPCIMSFGDGFLWWPRKVVDKGLITLEDEEFREG